MLRSIQLAWINSVRQPARTLLGILGIAAVGALLFDMLLLSGGLVYSFRELLDRGGFDVRILATDSPAAAGPQIRDADRIRATVGRLPEVEAVVPVSFGDAELVSSTAGADHSKRVRFLGADERADAMWTLLKGRDLAEADTDSHPVIVNRTMASMHGVAVGASLILRGDCGQGVGIPRPISFTVIGVGEFPFDDAKARTVAGRLSDLSALCDADGSAVDMLLVRSSAHDGGETAAASIRAATPGVHVVTNDELVERFSRVEFSYFRQISFVLATVTLFFGFLLIAVLLTASVNQRLAEIAALRALGLSRSRVIAGVLAESTIMVAIGAAVAVPVGWGLSLWLDEILRRLPGIPMNVHFFVFEPHVAVWYICLLAASAVGAALYPIRIVATLPIAATLRREVVG